MPWHFDEALVQREIVSYRVLPALFVLTVVWEVGHDVLVDAVERQPLLRRLANSHHDQSVVRERRLFVPLLRVVREFGHFGGVPFLFFDAGR